LTSRENLRKYKNVSEMERIFSGKTSSQENIFEAEFFMTNQK
jgi:hypothetical protein